MLAISPLLPYSTLDLILNATFNCKGEVGNNVFTSILPNPDSKLQIKNESKRLEVESF